jgi:hypothetical protein
MLQVFSEQITTLPTIIREMAKFAEQITITLIIIREIAQSFH